ncbi:hypothetical protein BDV93DRAFT_520593 [Ceratobasidium sp. AG-I]|nr:hypothetical protein BDV93DRAFT_520593 [Ceratobasidium sp. AG-I]
MSSNSNLRRHAACHECRRKKLKCNAGRPCCDNCRRAQERSSLSRGGNAGTVCTYDFAPGEEMWISCNQGTPRRAASTRNTPPRNSSSSGSSLDYGETVRAPPSFPSTPNYEHLDNMQQRTNSFLSLGVPTSIPHELPVATGPMWVASDPAFEGDLAWFPGGDTRALDQSTGNFGHVSYHINPQMLQQRSTESFYSGMYSSQQFHRAPQSMQDQPITDFTPRQRDIRRPSQASHEPRQSDPSKVHHLELHYL